MLRLIGRYILLSLILVPIAHANNYCLSFYSQKSSEGSLGPVAKELKSILDLGEIEIERAYARLDARDEVAVKKSVENAKEIEAVVLAAKIPIKDAPEQLKKLIKYEVLFGSYQTLAFTEAFENIFSKIELEGSIGLISAQREKLRSFEVLVTSAAEKDRKVVDGFVDLYEKSLRNYFTFNFEGKSLKPIEWKDQDSMQKTETAIKYAERMGLKRNDPNLLTVAEEINAFLNMPGSSHFLKIILRKTLLEQIQVVKNHLPTWKTRTGKAAITTTGLGLTVAGIYSGLTFLDGASSFFTVMGSGLVGGLSSLVSAVMPADPFIQRNSAAKKLRKKSEKNADQLLEDTTTQDALQILESRIKADEFREEKDDFSFSEIMNELKVGLSERDTYRIPSWGNELQQGLVNLNYRQSRLDSRIELISKGMEPVQAELKNGTPDVQRLSAYHMIVGIFEKKVQTLMMDLAFLRNDYLAISIVLDKYIVTAAEFSKSGRLDSMNQQFILDKIERLNRTKQRLFLSAEKTNSTLTYIRSVVSSLNDYREIVLTDLALSLKDHRTAQEGN